MPVIEEQVPKHAQLREILRGKIINEHKPDDRFDSEPQLIKKYSLSNTTVQKAISALVQEGLLTRIQGKGTFVAMQPVLKSYDIVIQKESFHTHSYWFDVIRGIELVASEDGMGVMVNTYNLEETDSSWEKIVRSVMDKPLSGTILIPPSDDKKMSILLKEKRPFVVIGNYPQFSELPSVGIDAYDGTFHMTEYLINKGHRKISLIGGIHSKNRIGMDFLNGYREALTVHGIPIREDWVMESEWLEEEGYRLTKILLQSKERPTAIFAGDDTIAVGVIKALTEASIKIPDEMAVVGFNDLDLASIVTPQLTTMRVPRFNIGEVACDMLLKLTRKENVPQKQIIFKAELVIRDST